MNIAKYDNQIQKVYWQAYTLNGKKCIQEGTIKRCSGYSNFKFQEYEDPEKKRVHFEKQQSCTWIIRIFIFYTRIKNSADCNYKKSLDFAK